MQPSDIFWGCSLRDKIQRERALKLQKLHRPRLVAIQFPCTVWSQTWRLKYHTPEAKKPLEALHNHDLVLLELAAQIARIHIENDD